MLRKTKLLTCIVVSASVFSLSGLGQAPALAATTSSSKPVMANQFTSSQTKEAKLNKLISVGKTQLGVKWRHGTQKPGYGFDCSNFTSWVYKEALGIKFSSSSRAQRYDKSIGTPVKIDKSNIYKNLQKGDLLFFANSADKGGGGHVGIYAGDGYILQCGGGRGKVTFEKMKGTWFEKKLVYAKRIVN
ncbi:C40 family peptidase [Effusibacillus lacus]|uniref:Hydrolase Nlp/P60 n=1 Tax=Effusibacillus lacus TaxID=1348429 RepID=A0A292YMF3_9BACL|nr:C40 family peptidase [Effusibacillus lacus]TCS70472.1 NlpC/P60 family protein [Effusibacillus lacus]GAX89574.1 hydrolase Nlp/P60 [Effusibacillus lacus]